MTRMGPLAPPIHWGWSERSSRRSSTSRVEVRFHQERAAEETPGEGREPDPPRADGLASDPLIQKVVELFEARPVQLDYDGPDAGSLGMSGRAVCSRWRRWVRPIDMPLRPVAPGPDPHSWDADLTCSTNWECSRT